MSSCTTRCGCDRNVAAVARVAPAWGFPGASKRPPSPRLLAWSQRQSHSLRFAKVLVPDLEGARSGLDPLHLSDCVAEEGETFADGGRIGNTLFGGSLYAWVATGDCAGDFTLRILAEDTSLGDETLCGLPIVTQILGETVSMKASLGEAAIQYRLNFYRLSEGTGELELLRTMYLQVAIVMPTTGVSDEDATETTGTVSFVLYEPVLVLLDRVVVRSAFHATGVGCELYASAMLSFLANALQGYVGTHPEIAGADSTGFVGGDDCSLVTAIQLLSESQVFHAPSTTEDMDDAAPCWTWVLEQCPMSDDADPEGGGGSGDGETGGVGV